MQGGVAQKKCLVEAEKAENSLHPSNCAFTEVLRLSDQWV